MNDNIIIGAIVANLDLYKELLDPSLEKAGLNSFIVPGTPETNIAAEYNKIIKNTAERYIIFCHPDVIFDKGIIDTIRNSGSGVFGGIGIIEDGEYIWADVVPPGEKKEVVMFDACLLIYDRLCDILFDEKTFSGLHMYVEDYCYQMRSSGHRLYVPHIPGFSHRGGDRYGGRNAMSYIFERHKLMKKWGLKFKIVTS